LKISDELSKIAADALADKNREKARKIALQRSKQQAETERLKKEKEDAARLKRLTAKRSKYVSTIRRELFLSVWDGKEKLVKENLDDWQIEALIGKNYRVLNIADERKVLNKTIQVDLPKAVKNLIGIITAASDKFVLIRTLTFRILSKNWSELDTPGLQKWLGTLNDAFSTVARTYASEEKFKNDNEQLYLIELRRLDARLRFITENIQSIDTVYFEKKASLGLSIIDSNDPERREKLERIKLIIRKVLEEQSRSSWQGVSNNEIQLIFHAARNGISLTSAASFLRRSSNSSNQFDDDEVINLLADFSEKSSDNRPFERIHRDFKLHFSIVEKLVKLLISETSKLRISIDPLVKSDLAKGFYIFPSKKCADFSIYDFLVGSDCKKFKFDMEQQMRSAAQRGAKSISLQGKDFEEGIELKSTAFKKIFLPFDRELFLDLVSADGLGYELYEEGSFKFTVHLLWN
jgi:hypothetical protein